jgi:cytochrome c oxidase subunit II
MSITSSADQFSQLFQTFITLGVIVGVVVISLIAYLVIRYRAHGTETDPEDAPRLGKIPATRGHLRTALISVGLSAIILSVLIIGTLAVTNFLNTIPAQCNPPPGNCVYIQVTGYRFGWNFTYGLAPNATVLRGNLTIPAGRVVVFVITSKPEYAGKTAVFHSFGIDDFRIKRDAIPGLINKMWVQSSADSVGLPVRPARCFELCGVGHDGMTASVSIVSPGQFSQICSSTTPGC